MDPPNKKSSQPRQFSLQALGLDHFEGRSWRGFHHHLVLAVLAYLFVTVVYLRAKKKLLV